MGRPRFTIGGILALVLFLGVGFAALKMPTDDWDAGVLGATLSVLLASTLLAIHRGGSSRAYWLGFALFGWAYFALCQVPSIEVRLPTTVGLDYLDTLVDEATSVRMALTFTVVTNTDQIGQTVVSAPPASVPPSSTASSENFVRIGHSLLALILAVVGAIASRSLHDREASRRAGRADQETSTSSPTASSEPAGSVASILMP